MDIQTFHDTLINLQPIDLQAYVQIIPELRKLQKCEQNPLHHAEGNVLIHAQMALDVVRPLLDQVPNVNDKVALYIATMLHDIGKPVTYGIHPVKGTITAYGHDKMGVPLANSFLRKYFPELSFPVRDKILALIEYHMKPREMMKTGTKDIKLQKMSLEVDFKLLHLLSTADTLGRKADDLTGGIGLLDKFKAEAQRLGIWDEVYIVPGTEMLSNHAYTLARWEILSNGKHEGKDLFDNCEKLAKAMPKFQLLVMCGAPGSGKSTYRESLLKQFPDVKVISMDDKRKELTGDVHNQTMNSEIFSICSQELLQAMRKKQSAIWDATSASKKHRKVVIDIARRYGALVGIIFFDLPLETLIERNAGREKKVPETVVREYYYQRMERISKYEADKVTVIEK